MRQIFAIVVVVLVGGCAANSGIVSMGQDTYFVSRQAPTGFSGSGNLKAEVLAEAGQFCGAQKKTLSVTNIVEAQPPFIFGNFPKAEIQFKCQ